MTLLLSLLGRLAPYLIAGALAAGAAGWAVHKFDSASYARLQAQFATYQAQAEKNEAAAEAAARNALATELQAAQATDTRNATIIEGLQSENATIARDRDLAHRLLSAATASASAPSAGHPVQQAAGQSGALAAGADSGTQALAGFCAGVADEDARNAAQLNALIAEIKPQL